jgi:hypothetical protein
MIEHLLYNSIECSLSDASINMYRQEHTEKKQKKRNLKISHEKIKEVVILALYNSEKSVKDIK